MFSTAVAQASDCTSVKAVGREVGETWMDLWKLLKVGPQADE